MNTPQTGQVRYIVFKDSDCWYAAGLEFNIVESGDDPKVALINLLEAMQGFVESCRKVKGARVGPLNQKPNPEYEKLWSIVTAQRKVKSPFEISTYGVAAL